MGQIELFEAPEKKKARSVNFTRAEINARFRRRHPERAKASSAEWGKRNRHRTREFCRGATRRAREAIFKLFGGKCVKCGFSDSRALQIDHIHGAKEPHSHRLRGGYPLYRAILRGERDVDEFQLLCANCNSIKIFENKEFAPYKKEWEREQLA